MPHWSRFQINDAYIFTINHNINFQIFLMLQANDFLKIPWVCKSNELPKPKHLVYYPFNHQKIPSPQISLAIISKFI